MKLIQVGIGNANPAQKSKIFELAPRSGSSQNSELEPAAEAAEVLS